MRPKLECFTCLKPVRKNNRCECVDSNGVSLPPLITVSNLTQYMGDPPLTSLDRVVREWCSLNKGMWVQGSASKAQEMARDRGCLFAVVN